jgi:AcrR family transcriptional regulator
MVQIAASPRSADRQREILRAASGVFRRQGLHATGMRDIAAELGMAVGNLYYYFANKEALLAFCQEDALRGLLALAQEVKALPGRADARLHRLLAGHVQLLNEETPGSLAHLEVEALAGRLRRAVMDKRRAYERALQELLRDGIEQRVFRAVDIKVASFALLGAVNWTVKWFRPDGGRSAAQIGAECAELLVRGLMRDGVEPRFTAEEPS